MRASAASVNSSAETCPVSSRCRASCMVRYASEACVLLSTCCAPLFALVLVEHGGYLEESVFFGRCVAEDVLGGPGRARLVGAQHIQMGQYLGGRRAGGSIYFLQHGDVFEHVQKLHAQALDFLIG